MRRLLPTGRSLELEDPYPALEPPGTWVAIGMVTSVDGAVSVDGRSGGLGGAGDRAAFRALRALADVVLVGLGTATAESYRAAWTPRHVDARAARGQPPIPRLALVTGSGRVPADLRTLDEPAHPPLVLTTAAGAREARPRVGDRAEVVVVPATGEGQVEPAAAVAALAERGLGRVVCEGGPTLNHAMLSAGVVDELWVTIAPQLLGGSGGLAGDVLPAGPRALVLHELRVHGSELVCRYRCLDPRQR